MRLFALRGISSVVYFIVAMALVSCEQPSFQEQYDQCRKTCSSKGMFGSMKRKEGPASPKPLANQYECVCS